MKVLLLPNFIGGHLQGVKEGLRLNGVESTVLYASEDKFSFGYDHSIALGRMGFAKKIAVAWRYFRDYDVIHFNEGKSLVPFMIDVFLAKTMGKRVFVTFNGTFSRPKIRSYFIHEFSQWGRKRSFSYSLRDFVWDTIKTARNYTWVITADKVFCLNPDLRIGLWNTVFLPYMKKGVSEIEAVPYAPCTGPLVIAHAPTSRAVKGTEIFLKAVSEINQKAERIKVVLIENVDNRKTIELMNAAHMLFDQLLVGWYGGVAVEAMSLGIPVIAYLREDDLRRIPQDMREDLPVIKADPDSIKSVLLRLVEGGYDLAQKSRESVQYVRKYHNIDKLGKTLLRYYSKEAHHG